MITGSVRSPREVIDLVCPENAEEVESILVKALESVPGTLIWVENGHLAWCHVEQEARQ